MSEFETLLGKMGKKRVDGARAVIVLDIWKVQTSCGYGVPRLSSTAPILVDLEKTPEAAFEDRETLGHWAGKQVERNLIHSYQMEWNAKSLDGLDGLKSARRDLGQSLWLGDLKARGGRVLAQKEALGSGVFIGISLVLIAGLLQKAFLI